MLRPESWTRPAGESPVRVIAGEPGSRPRFVAETRRAERGVKSLFGGSKRAGRSATRRESCSLVRLTMGEPSRSCHGEGPCPIYWRSGNALGRVPSGYGERHVRTVWFGTGETRLCSLVSKDRLYKPVVKTSGAQRESDGVVVPPIAGRNLAGGKGPDFGHADRGSTCEGMAGTARPNHPDGLIPVVNAPQSRRRLWASAKSFPQQRVHVLDPWRSDFRQVAWSRCRLGVA
jgi:hypothetical protein